jgi:hypothetical protein
MKCELCELKIKTNVYLELDSFIILDCKDCHVPMIVWKEHTMDVHELDQNLLETFLVECAKQFYVGEEFYISKDQRKIADHFHWHARKISEKKA